MNNAADTLLDKLENVKHGSVVNIHNMFGGYTQEIIGTSVFGRHFQSQKVPESNGDTALVAEKSVMEGPLHISMYRAVATIFANSSGDLESTLSLLCPVLLPLLKMIAEIFPSKTTLHVRRAINVMSEVGERMLTETKGCKSDSNLSDDLRKDRPTSCSDSFMERMIIAKDKETGRSLTENEIIAQSTTFIAGGTETTASTLSYAIYLISQHPEVEEKIMAEVDSCAIAGPSYEYIMENMKYIHAVLYETLRLYPSGGFISRITNTEVMVGKYKVPANTPVIIPLVLLQTLPEHFPNPNEFKPERHLDEVPTWHKYAYIPFGLGQRKCIGYKLAMAEAALGLFKLYRKHSFRIAALTPTPDLPLKQGITLQPKDGVCVHVYHRSQIEMN